MLLSSVRLGWRAVRARAFGKIADKRAPTPKKKLRLVDLVFITGCGFAGFFFQKNPELLPPELQKLLGVGKFEAEQKEGEIVEAPVEREGIRSLHF